MLVIEFGFSIIFLGFQYRQFTVGQNVTEIKANVRDVENKPIDLKNFFKGRKVVLFGVPGAFTPVCSNQHVPAFVKADEQLKKQGISAIACVSVNDAFTMKAWGKQLNAGNIQMLADWNSELSKGKYYILSLIDIDCCLFFKNTKNKLLDSL